MLKILFFLCLFCPKTCIPARPPPRFAAQLPCSVGVLFQYMLCRRAKRTGMGCSHPTSNFTTPCKKKTASAFLHADGFWRRWWVLPRPKNSPPGCFCPAGRKAPGTGCSHPTSNFTTLCKKKTASAFLHADGFWRRWWVLPRPKNSPPGCFCPAGRKAPGTGCSHPTSNFTTLCKKKTASAFLHADGFWRRWWDSNPRARLRTKRFRVFEIVG